MKYALLLLIHGLVFGLYAQNIYRPELAAYLRTHEFDTTAERLLDFVPRPPALLAALTPPFANVFCIGMPCDANPVQKFDAIPATGGHYIFLRSHFSIDGLGLEDFGTQMPFQWWEQVNTVWWLDSLGALSPALPPWLSYTLYAESDSQGGVIILTSFTKHSPALLATDLDSMSVEDAFQQIMDLRWRFPLPTPRLCVIHLRPQRTPAVRKLRPKRLAQPHDWATTYTPGYPHSGNISFNSYYDPRLDLANQQITDYDRRINFRTGRVVRIKTQQQPYANTCPY